MIGVVILLCGMAIGAALTVAVQQSWIGYNYPKLPAATAREVSRDRRRNRADLRLVMRPLDLRPAREVGVRVRERDEAYVFRDHPPRLERLGEPPALLPDVEAFDHEETHR